MVGATNSAGTAQHYWIPGFIPVFSGMCDLQSLVFYVVEYGVLLSYCTFFFCDCILRSSNYPSDYPFPTFKLFHQATTSYLLIFKLFHQATTSYLLIFKLFHQATSYLLIFKLFHQATTSYLLIFKLFHQATTNYLLIFNFFIRLQRVIY